MSSEPLLRVENLTTQFFTETGTVRAVDGISFEIREGEIVGLVGESGAGKSVASMSLLRLVENPGEIVGGEITYKGETIVGFEEGPDGASRARRHALERGDPDPNPGQRDRGDLPGSDGVAQPRLHRRRPTAGVHRTQPRALRRRGENGGDRHAPRGRHPRSRAAVRGVPPPVLRGCASAC